MRISKTLFSPGILQIAIILCAISGVQGALFPGPTTRVVIQTAIAVILICALAIKSDFLLGAQLPFKNALYVVFVYGIWITAYSSFYANSYEQWRYLGTVFFPACFLPLFSFLCTKPVSINILLQSGLFVVLPISTLFWITGPQTKNYNLQFVYFTTIFHLLILFLPFVSSNRLKFICLLGFAANIVFDMDNRTNLVSGFIAAAIALHLLLLKMGRLRSSLVFTIGRRIFLYLPIIIVASAFYFQQSPFQAAQELFTKWEDSSDSSGRSLVVDSRTSIYLDAIEHFKKRGGVLFGHSAVVMQETSLAESSAGYEEGRLGGTESGLLSFMLFGGICYVAAFFFLCMKSSWLAIYRSNNSLSRAIGLFIAVRWALTFIESPIALNFLWLAHYFAIGLALSPSIRSLSDVQLANVFRGK